MDRRNFIHGAARGGLLAILGVVTGVLVFRKQVTLQDECLENFQCRNCTKLSSCELPEASNTKDNGEEG